MKKIILSTIAASVLFCGTAIAGDNILGRGAENLGGIQDQYRNSGASFGVSYTYRFGASKAEEYGSLNIRNLHGRNIPVINFSARGTAPSQLVLMAADDGRFIGMNRGTWLYVIGGTLVVAAGILLLTKSGACDPPRVLVSGRCLDE